MASFTLTACWLSSSAAALSFTLVKTQTPATPAVGTPILYQIVLTNTGSETINNYNVMDTISATLGDLDLTNDPFYTQGLGVYLVTSSTTYLNWSNTVPLLPGRSMTFTISGSVGSTGVSGSIVNSASVTASGPLTSGAGMSNSVSFFADAAVIPPSAPGPLTEYDNTDGQLTLQWAPGTPGTNPVSGYQIWRSSNGGGYLDYGLLATVSTTWYDAPATFGYFLVRTVDTAGLVGRFTPVFIVGLIPLPKLQVWATSEPSAGNAGQNVDYRISFSNYSTYSAFTVIITTLESSFTDRIKVNSTPGVLWVGGGSGAINPPLWATNLGGPWLTTTNTGLTEPLYLRWVLTRVGMQKSGYIRYATQVRPAGSCQPMFMSCSVTGSTGFPDFIQLPYVFGNATTYCSPGAPAPVSAAEYPSSIGLEWGPAPLGQYALSSYEIWRSTCATCAFSFLATQSESVSTYTDSPVAAASPFFYRVRGVDVMSNPGSWSASVTASGLSAQYLFETVSPSSVAPGDSLNYSLAYSLPAGAVPSNVVIFETLPPYTHYVFGSASVTPDPGWDPEPGPPSHLRWTLPGPFPAGVSGTISYQLTVDWGNMESFEPGSGDVAAPQGASLNGKTSLAWAGGIPGGMVGPGTAALVDWFEFNKSVTDLGNGEVEYTLAVRNPSLTKTWRNVTVWDTVPADLSVWSTGHGFDDPCLSWTMTPSGCPPYSPSKVLSGVDTVLRWAFDLAPQQSVSIAWRAGLQPSIVSCTLVENVAAVRSAGMAVVPGGVGNSGLPATAISSTVICPPIPPGAPTSLTAFGAGLRIQLGWTEAVPGTNAIQHYEIWTATCSGCGMSIRGTSNTTTFVDGVAAGTTAYYQVRAVDTSFQNGPFSPVASATAVAPTVIVTKTMSPPAPLAGEPVTYTITAVSDTNQWLRIVDTPPVGMVVTGFSTPAAWPGFPAITPSPTLSASIYEWFTTYGDAGVVFTVEITGIAPAAATTYCNSALAHLQNGPGPTTEMWDVLSTPVCFTITPTGPAAPATLSATSGPVTIGLVWSPAAPGTNAVSAYEVWRATCSACPSSLYGTEVGQSFDDTGITTGIEYTYRVRAVDVEGLVGAFSLTATGMSTCTGNEGYYVTPMNGGRAGHGAAVVGGTLYVMGGYYPSGNELASVEAYDPATLTWTNRTPMPTARHDLAVAAMGSMIYAVGGINASELATVERYNPATNAWLARASLPAPRQAAAAAAVSNTLYVIGGGTGGLAVGSVVAYDPFTNSWAAKSAMPTPRAGLGVAAVNGIVYAVGGVSGTMLVDTVEAYDPVADTWTTRAPLPEADYQMSVVSVGGTLYAIGGMSPTVVRAYDPATDTWTRLCPLYFSGWHMAAAVIGGTIYATGGDAGREQHAEAYLAPTLPAPNTPPPAPVSVVATPGPASVTLNWITGGPCTCVLQHYEIWRSTCGGCPQALYTLVDDSATYFVDRYLTGGSTYEYTVRAVNSYGTPGAFSGVGSAVPGPGDPPPVPAALSALPGPASVTLSWLTGGPCGCVVQHYEIWRSTCGGCPKTPWSTVDPSATLFVDQFLTGGVTYEYAVRSVNTDGTPGGFSTDAGSTAGPGNPPPAPGSVTTVPGPSSITLSWLVGGPCTCVLMHYEIWRATCGGCPQTLYTIVGASATFFEDQSLPGGITYEYSVRAVNMDGTPGAYSGTSGTTPGAGNPPPAPMSLTATPGPELVTLHWYPASPCTCVLSAYEIWRATCGGCPKTLLIVVDSSVTAYVDRYLTTGETYEYAVRGINTDGTPGVFSPTGGCIAGPGALTLSLLKTVSPANPVPGQAVTYGLLITNTGSVVLDALTLIDTVPTAISQVTTSEPAGFSPPSVSQTASGSLYIWSASGLGLAPGATLSFTLTGLVGVLPGPMLINNIACSHAENGPEADATTSPAAFFTATPTASLACTSTVSATLFAIGEWYTVSLTVTCTGWTHCVNVGPTCTLTGPCTLIAGPTPYPTLQAGEVHVYTWTFSCSGAGAIAFSTSCTGAEGWSGRVIGCVPTNGPLPPCSGALQATPSCSLTLVSGNCHRARVCVLRCTVLNLGGYTCHGISATVYLNGDTFIIPALIGTDPLEPILPGSSTNYEWTFTPTGTGDVCFTVSVYGLGLAGAAVSGSTVLCVSVTEEPAVMLAKEQVGGGAIGAALTWRVVLTNTGGVTFTNVVVTDTVTPVAGIASIDAPAGFALTVTDVTSGTRYVWSGAGLTFRPGTSLTFTLTGLVGSVCAATAVSNTAWASAWSVLDAAGAASATSNVVGFAIPAPALDFTVVKTRIPAAPGIGEPIQYQILVTNTGSVPIEHLNVTDTLSPVVQVTGTTQPGFGAAVVTSVAGSGSRYVWSGTGLNLPPAGSLTITVDGLISSVCMPTAVANTAFVDGGTGCADVGRLSNAVGVLVQPAAAGLTLVNTQSPAAPAAGAPVTYTLVIMNTGSATLTGVTVTDTLSPVVAGVLPTTPAGFSAPVVTSVAGSGTRYVWIATAPLLPGASATFQLAGTAGDSCVQATVSNTAYAAGDGPCASVQATGVAEGFTLIGPTLAYTAVVEQSPASPAAGGPVTYRIVVTNTGTALLTDLVVVDAVASGVTGVTTAQPAPFPAPVMTAVSGGVRYVWSATGLSLAPGASLTLTITGAFGQVTQDATVANRAVVTAGNGCAVVPLVSNEVTATLKAPPVIEEPVEFGKVKIVGGIRGYINPKRGETSTMLIRPTGPGEIHVRIYDQDGVLIWQVTQSTAGGHTEVVQWRGVDMAGRQVVPGLYPLVIEAPGIRYRDTLVVVR